MSKPNPSITANLLTSLLEQKGTLHEVGAGAGSAGQKVASDTSAKPPIPRASKLGPSRKAPGPGHMRSSPRGK